MSFLCRCVNCSWVGDETDADSGVPVDDTSDYEPGDFADETSIRCPECEHAVIAVE